jgi:hypothetical protein
VINQGRDVLHRARTQGAVVATPALLPQPPTSRGAALHPPVALAPAAETLSDVEVLEPEAMQPVEASLEAGPLRNVALLHVQPHQVAEGPAFLLLGANEVHELPWTNPQKRPSLVLADLAQNVHPETTMMPEQILAIMRQFSMDNRDLVDWVNSLCEAHGEDLLLVVLDYTGFEIPWELLTLRPPTREGRETFLGTAVSISRWQDVRDERSWSAQYGRDYPLELDEVEYGGRIVAYVDNLVEGARLDNKALQETGATPEKCLRDLRERLLKAEAGLGLVYLATHGHYATNPLEFALGSESDADEQLVLGLLRDKEFYLFEQSDAVVFLNTCHSGRMFKEEQYLKSDRLRGFPELFLSKGARGVIATTGLVNSAFAATAAEQLIGMLRTRTLPISVLLREWRRGVVQGLPSREQRTKQDMATLLNTCMYVYYGNPRAGLRVRREAAG